MKILQVNCVYAEGSTGKIVADIHKQLKQNGIESVVCYGRRTKTSEPSVYKTCGELYAKMNNLRSRVTGLMYGGCFLSTNSLLRRIQKEKPDIVHLHCINGYFVNIYRLVRWLKRQHIPTVLTLHAEFMHTANCGHAFECDAWKTGCGHCPRLRKETGSWFFDGTHRSWVKMKQAFEGFEHLTVVSVSPWLMERAKQSPILKDFEHLTVFNGLAQDVFCPTASDVRELLGLIGKKIVFHATPSFNNDKEHIKGGYYLLRLAEKMPDVTFVVAGNHAPDLQVPSNVILLGRVTDQHKLASYYSAADLTLITSKKETFSMIVAESLCCGTPVVGFCAGAPERIALPAYSKFVPHGDEAALLQATETMLTDAVDRDALVKEAQATYAKEIMASRYIEIYKTRGNDS